MLRYGTIILGLALTVAVALPYRSATAQQQGKVYRIGFLTAGSEKAYKPRLAALRLGLRDLGYRLGRDYVMEPRFAAGHRKELPRLAAELAGLHPSLIVTNGSSATKAVNGAIKIEAKRIPIVFALAPDPVGAGLVASLARPGGNVTGLSNANNILVAKRLTIINEALPNAKRIAVLWSGRARGGPPQLENLKEAAQQLGMTLIPVAFDHPDDFDKAFDTIEAAKADALNVFGWSLASAFRKKITARALASNLPTMFTGRRYVLAGGLMSYGVSPLDLYRRAAVYVDKILKGANPADLPVERPNRFRLTVNLKTAQKLGATIPSSILLRADEVIE